MSTLITVTTTDGRVLSGLSYRLDPNNQSAITLGTAGAIQGPLGWISIPFSQIVSIEYRPGRPT